MAETLESNIIRHLIMKARITGGQISDIGRTIVEMAVKDGLLAMALDLAYENSLADKITAVIWELIIEGVYTPGLAGCGKTLSPSKMALSKSCKLLILQSAKQPLRADFGDKRCFSAAC
jgi:hypothetical protein